LLLEAEFMKAVNPVKVKWNSLLRELLARDEEVLKILE
jgi:hypothetical protein